MNFSHVIVGLSLAPATIQEAKSVGIMGAQLPKEERLRGLGCAIDVYFVG